MFLLFAGYLCGIFYLYYKMTCCAPNCKSYASKKEPGVTFHCFPKEEKLRDAWKEACRRDGKLPCKEKNLMLCSKHFLEKDIDRMSVFRVRLRENVVPSVFKRLSPRLLLQKKSKKSRGPRRQRVVVKVEEDSSSNMVETAVPDCVRDIKPMTLAESNIDSDADMDVDRKPIMQPMESAPDIPPIIIQEVRSLLMDPCFKGKLVSHIKDIPVNSSKRKSEKSAPDPITRQVMEENSSIVKPVPLIKIIPRVSNDSPGVAKVMEKNSSTVKPVPLVRIIPQVSNEDSLGVAKALSKTSSIVKPVPLVKIIPPVSNEAAEAMEKNSSIVKPVPLVKIIPPVSNEATEGNTSIVKPVPLVRIIPQVSNEDSPGVAKAMEKTSSIVKPVPLVRIIPNVSNGAAKATEENSSMVKPVPLVKIIPPVSNEATEGNTSIVKPVPLVKIIPRVSNGSPGVAKAKKKTSSIKKPVPLVKKISPVSNEAAKATEENSSILKPVLLVTDDATKSHFQPVAKKTVRRRTACEAAGNVMKVSLNCPHCQKACNICMSVNPPSPAKPTPSEKKVHHLKQREEWLMKKVKVLNQSVRRLNARNAYLKEMVKYFVQKEKKADLVVIGSINGVLEG